MTSLLNVIRAERASQYKPKTLSETNVKRLTPKDANDVNELVGKNSLHVTLFGYVNVEELLSKCYLNLGIEDDAKNLVGVVCFHDYPNIPSITPWNWTDWLENMYGLEEISPRNTLWIHLIAWNYEYNFLFLTPILQHIFKCIYYMENILWALPPGLKDIDFLENKATKILPRKYQFKQKTQCLYLMVRQHYTEKYKIRRAVEEDNDNLVDLIDIYSKRLKELYGEFYIAELLTVHKNCGRQIIVAEYQGNAVAIICVNEYVNVNMLNEEFELGPYNGLRKGNENLSADNELLCNILPKPQNIKNTDPSVNISELVLNVEMKTESEEEFLVLTTTTSIYSFSDVLTDEFDQHHIKHRETYVDYLNRPSITPTFYTDKLHQVCKLDVPTYDGELNAFAVEILATYPQHLPCLPEMFEAVFECFPDRDYCVLTTPTNTRSTLRFNEFFVRVPLRPTSSSKELLYVMTKCSIRSKIAVKLTTEDDKIHIEEFLNLCQSSYSLKCLYRDHLSSEFSLNSLYAMFCDEQIVGLAMISPEINVDQIEKLYKISDWVYDNLQTRDNYGVFEFYILCPQFHNHVLYFLKEIHRLSDFNILLYKLQFKKQRNLPYNNLIEVLIPVMPRKAQYKTGEDLNTDSEEKLTQALFLSSISHCSLPRLVFTENIVIVGYSLTASAFMETLIWPKVGPYLTTFINITLLSQSDFNKRMSSLMEFSMKKSLHDYRLMDCLYLTTYINLICGTMTKIHRKEKYVRITDNSFTPYDYLFLMCGEQFLRPSKIRDDEPIPKNVFVINTNIDITKSLLDLNRLMKHSEESIIVYGHYLHSYTMLGLLVDHGIDGKNIILIEPFPENSLLTKRTERYHNVSMFNNELIDKTVMDAIKDEGITVYQSYYFKKWTLQDDKKIISSVTFESQYNLLTLNCVAFYVFENKTIRPITYEAIENAGLVFDGRLVIDCEFKTNDDYIYAAGTITKYSRKYMALDRIHKYYNREEIGSRLGEQIKCMLTPDTFYKCVLIKKEKLSEIQPNKLLVPIFKLPIVRHTTFPGKLHYFSISKPGIRVPLSIAETRKNYGTVLVTGNCDNLEKQGYFRLHFNQFNKVETITCLAKFRPDINNLTTLYGKHEQLLNNIILRCKMKLIKDLFKYFKEPWCFAIYNDKFPVLEKNLNNHITNLTFENKTLPVRLTEELIINNWQKLSTETIKDISEKYITDEMKDEITQKILKFLEDNKTYLPMYAISSVIEKILQNYTTSPLFQ